MFGPWFKIWVGYVLLFYMKIVLGKIRMHLFGWDAVPVFIHMCNASRPMNSTVKEHLATFPIVKFEKSQGYNTSNNSLPSNYTNEYSQGKIIDALCKAVK